MKEAFVVAGLCVALCGCTSPALKERLSQDHSAGEAAARAMGGGVLAEQAGRDIAGGPVEAQRRAALQAAMPVMLQSRVPFVSAASVAIAPNASTSDPLPTVFSENLKLGFDDRPGLRVMAERLAGITGIAVRIKPDALSVSTAGVVPVVAPVQVPMRWDGTLSGYLDHVTDLSGLSWEYRDGAIVIERLVTRFFALSAFDGETSYALGMTGADNGTSGSSQSGGSSSSSATSDVKETGKKNPIAAALATIKALVKDVPGSEVIRIEGSGRIAVTSSKEALAQVDAFVRTENAAMNRQAQVQFDIYTIRRAESDSRGIDWQSTLQLIAKGWGFKVGSPGSLSASTAGQVTFTVLDSDASSTSLARRLGGSQAILSMLAETGAVTEHRPVSMIGRNQQWMRKASINSRAYVSETVASTGSLTGAGAPGLKTSTITTGDRFAVLANIGEGGAITLKFGIGLSSLVNLASFTSGAGANAQTVQTPETSAILDQSEVTLRPGQALAITGLSRVVSTENSRALDQNLPLAAGGSRRLERVREDFVVLLRPSLL